MEKEKIKENLENLEKEEKKKRNKQTSNYYSQMPKAISSAASKR